MTTFSATGGSADTCPHCGADNAADSVFCEQCGKALPSGASTGPRVVEGSGLASTSGGRRLQAAELQKKARSAAGALLAVGIIQAIFTVIIYFIASSQAAKDPNVEVQMGVIVMLGGVSLVFFGLWAWARSNPLPAAIVGLVIYVTLWLVDIAADPTTAFKGIIIKIFIVVVLVKAIQAGVQHRQLMREQR